MGANAYSCVLSRKTVYWFVLKCTDVYWCAFVWNEMEERQKAIKHSGKAFQNAAPERQNANQEHRAFSRGIPDR